MLCKKDHLIELPLEKEKPKKVVFSQFDELASRTCLNLPLKLSGLTSEVNKMSQRHLKQQPSKSKAVRQMEVGNQWSFGILDYTQSEKKKGLL